MFFSNGFLRQAQDKLLGVFGLYGLSGLLALSPSRLELRRKVEFEKNIKTPLPLFVRIRWLLFSVTVMM